MVAVVVDSSAIVEVFVGRDPHPELRRRAMASQLMAPELVDCEVLQTLRRMERTNQLTDEQIQLTVKRLADSPIARVPHRPLISRIWQLRHCTTAYDGAYVALAEQLGIPLVTCDGRLAKSHGHSAQIECYDKS